MAKKSAAPIPQPSCPRCGHAADAALGPLNFCPECGQDLRGAAADEPSSSALLGKVVADRYRLLALLGEGGMGSVFNGDAADRRLAASRVRAG